MATRQVPMLSLEAAKVATDASEKKAKEMGIGTLDIPVPCYADVI